MIWGVDKAQERFNLAHAALGVSQAKLQAFLEEQLDAKDCVRSYGTTTNPSQQLKNKLGQAGTIPGGLLTLSVESRAVHDRAVKTLAEDWATNVGWPKIVACVAIVHPTDAGWKLATIVEWKRSRFPEQIRKRLFPDVVVVPASGSPAARSSRAGSDDESTVATYSVRLETFGSKIRVKQLAARDGGLEVEDRERLVEANDDAGLVAAVRAAIAGRL